MNEVIATLVGLAGLAGLLWFYATITDRQDLEIFAERTIMTLGALVMIIVFLLLSSKPGSNSSTKVKPYTSGVSSSNRPLSEDEDKRLRLDAYHDCLDYDTSSSCSKILED